ncbi:hypothetical protein [Nocardia abscessus]|uniref:hypothetical protein n=1 Tax=Nocardia abscessus TaxID=120957 RepID=UPI002454C11A|nr:hypothetical protein [Nocardia abscessus]
MSKSIFYIDPPHLIISAYSVEPEERTFYAASRSVEGLGAVPGRAIEVAPSDVEFDWLSDLVGVKEVVVTDKSAKSGIHSRPGMRVIRAEFELKRLGMLVLEYGARGPGDRHPIGIALSAGALGIPFHLLSKKQRGDARYIATWSHDALQVLVRLPGVLYGTFNVEATMPTPSQLSGSTDLAADLFVSHMLLAKAGIGARLQNLYTEWGGRFEMWPEGIFFTGWNPALGDSGNILELGRVRRVSAKLLSRAISEVS